MWAANPAATGFRSIDAQVASNASSSKWRWLVVHDLDFQQIHGGQQIRVLGFHTFGERHSWFTGATVGLYFILNKFNLLASLVASGRLQAHHAIGLAAGLWS